MTAPSRRPLFWLPFLAGLAACTAFAQELSLSKQGNAPGSARAETNSMDALDDHRKLAIGDRLSYRVVEERTADRPIFLTDSGEVDVPLIGRIPAEGKTCKELALTIKSQLEKDYFWPGHATVIIGLDVAAKSRGRVFMTGGVRTQGALEIPPTGSFTVSQALLQVGFGDFADQHRVTIQRKGPNGTSQRFMVDVAKILKGATNKDVELLPDDVVIVPEKLVNF